MKVKSWMNTISVFIVILLLSSEAFGQSADTLKYILDFQIGGQRKRGLFSQTALRIISNNELENNRLVLTNLWSYTYTEVNGNNIADDWHIKTYAMLKLNSTTRLLPVFAHNYFKNVLYRITSSHRALAGVRIIPVKQYSDFSFLVGAGYEFCNYRGEVFINSLIVSSQRNFALVFFENCRETSIGEK